MDITSNVTISVAFSGDLASAIAAATGENTASPGAVTVQSLASGANTISVPAGGKTVTGVLIVPPDDNTQTMTLKGVTGDTGVALHATNPSFVSLKSDVTSFVITAGGTIAGVQFAWA